MRAVLLCLLFFGVRLSVAQALQVDIEEFKRLAGEVADLRDANVAQQRRIANLQKEVEQLREALRAVDERTISRLGEFATREDLKKIVDQIKNVDDRRESDRKLVLQEFENLGKAISQTGSRSRSRDPEPASRSEPEKPFEGTVLPYKVKPNEALSKILEDYNHSLKEQGLPTITMKDVLRANPKLNPNRIFVGQTIDLPVPEKKK